MISFSGVNASLMVLLKARHWLDAAAPQISEVAQMHTFILGWFEYSRLSSSNADELLS